ncbi:MAG: signal peptidase II [Patescibacteria group bacterium]|jgi:lipoprotein signal peptidase
MKRFLALGAITAIGIADVFGKYLALHWLPIFDGSHFELLKLELYTNKGAVFSLDIPQMLIIILSILLMFFLIVAFKKQIFSWDNSRIGLFASITAIEIGALGNVVERIASGYVTDYLIFFNTSAINLSDILILSGIFGLFWYSRKSEPKN